MRTAFLGVSNNILLKAGLDGLRSGDIISVKIIKNQNGLIKASVRGKLILLKGSAELQAGKHYRVRAQWSGKTLLLNRIDNKNSAASLFGSSSMEAQGPEILFSAAKRAGLHLKDENLKILKRLLRKKGNLDEEKARIASEAVKKGLAPEELLSIAGNYSNQDEGTKEKVILFNQLKNGNELWFIVPFNFKFEGYALGGSLRIRKKIDIGKIDLAVIETSIQQNRIYFLLSDWDTANKSLKVFTEAPLEAAVKKCIMRGLPEILGNLKIKIDDNIIEDCFRNNVDNHCFDGFTFSELSLGSVEEIV